MASKMTRRSISFEILSNDSPGDGDSFVAGEERTTPENRAASRRRRKKSRGRKLSVGDLSPISSSFAEDFSSVSPSPSLASFANLQGPLRALGVNSALLSSSHWQNGVSPSDSSPALSVRSIIDDPISSNSQPASSRSLSDGVVSAGSVRALGTFKEPSVRRIEESPSNSSHEKPSFEEGMQGAGGSQEIFSDPQILAEAGAGSPTPASSTISYAGSHHTDAGGTFESVAVSERIVIPDQRSPPNVPPDFSSASEGLADPPHAPGALHPPTELRQRVVEKTLDRETENVANGERKPPLQPPQQHQQRSSTGAREVGTPPASKIRLNSFATPQLKDWERLMANNARYPPPLELSPMQYLATEVCSGSTLRNTTSVGTDQKRERVYNTMFHVPWRCELLIDVGFIVCLDAFLSLFTIMPARIIMFTWQRLAGLVKHRQLQRLHAAELCDFGCLVVLVVGVAILMQADVSIMYHWIRGQGVVKLYVVFNVLEIFDKLCQSFGADVLQVLFNSAVSVECCISAQVSKEIAKFAFDQCIAVFSFFVHSLVIISQAITISAAVNAQNNALLTLLISNNFAEIKSNVFKRMGTDQLHKMAYHDTVERFHITTHVLFVWAQNVLNTEESLWPNFFYNAGMVFVCEVMVDVIKHSFLAKFNEVKPAAYSDFLQALCSQTLNSQSHEVHKTLTFVPLAPACVVMRILLPVYAAFVPEGPKWWRWPCILLQGGLTYIALILLKVTVGLGLQFHAKWYLNRHPWTTHPHSE